MEGPSLEYHGLPPPRGLYHPQYEKEACGVGFIVNINLFMGEEKCRGFSEGQFLKSKMSEPPQERPELPPPDFEESSTGKLAKKSKDSPLVIIGTTACFIIAGVGLYRFRHRGKLSASNYLMQLRVTAQGAVIGCLTLGVLKSLYDHFQKSKEDPK